MWEVAPNGVADYLVKSVEGDDIDGAELNEDLINTLVLERSSNKLYSIFKSNGATPKRKLSPIALTPGSEALKTTNIRNCTEEDSSPLLHAEWSFLKPGTSTATNTPTRKPGPNIRARRRGLLNIEDPK